MHPTPRGSRFMQHAVLAVAVAALLGASASRAGDPVEITVDVSKQFQTMLFHASDFSILLSSASSTCRAKTSRSISKRSLRNRYISAPT